MTYSRSTTPKPYKKGRFYWLRVSDPQGYGHVRVSTRSSDSRTANALARMVADLRERGDLRVLTGIVKRERPLLAVWQDYVHAPQHLRSTRAALDDADLEPYAARWHTSLTKRKRLSADAYLKMLRRFMPEGQPFLRSRFTRSAVRSFLDGLTHDHGRKARPGEKAPDPKPVDGATRNRYHNALRGFARWLIEEHDGVLDTNPAAAIRTARENKRVLYYDETDARRLIEDFTSGDQQLLEAIACGTGIEWGVLAGLRRRDIDLDRRHIRAAGTKTEHRDRVCAVTIDWCWPLIERGVQSMLPNTPLRTRRYEAVLRAHHDAVAAAGLSHSRIHDWRHTYSVAMLRRGVAAHIVARQLGHADATLVYRRYGRFIPSVDEVQLASAGSGEVTPRIAR